MKEGRASRTAEIVCMGRAAAHGRTGAARYSDPTALELLPDESRKRVLWLRSGEKPKTWRGYAFRAYLERQSKVMVARTVAIDDAIRKAAAPQLVILGAGLDGRAFRMPELATTVVFEVDHPDSQRDKRARAAPLTLLAREHRYVPVDFERDDLSAALDAAGHDPSQPTTWVWEGVVMYLALPDIEATLRIIQRRSAAGSVLSVIYHRPAPLTKVVGLLLGRLGEPLRSAFTADAMRDLLAAHGFIVFDDQDMAEIGATLSEDVARGTKIARHLRLATARRSV